MKEFSEQLKIPWQKKPLQDVTRKRLHNSAKRKARKEQLRIARALKPHGYIKLTEFPRQSCPPLRPLYSNGEILVAKEN